MDRISEMSRRISTHCDAVERAAQLLSGEVRGIRVTGEHVEDALIALFNIENPVDLLNRDWTPTEIAHALSEFDFAQLKPLAMVELEASILPPGVPRRLDEVKVKVRGEGWCIHKKDLDPFPSSPHAHNYDSGHKMGPRHRRPVSREEARRQDLAPTSARFAATTRARE